MILVAWFACGLALFAGNRAPANIAAAETTIPINRINRLIGAFLGFGHRRTARGHTKNAATGCNKFVAIHQGDHGADMLGGAKEGETDIQIMHFPVRSTEQYRSKIVNGGQAYLRNPDLPENWGWHWRRWYRWYEQDGQDPQRSLRECIPMLRDAEARLASGALVKEEAKVRGLFEGKSK